MKLPEGDSGGDSTSEGAITGIGPAPVPGVGPTSFRPVPLSTKLLSSAIRFLDAALTAYGRGERDVFALHAGVAIEHLMKARLAAINPMLILDTDRRPKVEALLWLAEPWKNAQRPPESLRTIGGERATELLSPRVVDLSSYAEALTKLRDQRNGIGHFGSADLDSVVEHLPMILAAAVDLTHGLVDDSFVIFGSHREFAVEQLDEWADAEQRELAGRFTQARQRLAERDPPLTPEMRAVIERTIKDGHETNRTPDDQLATCPVCGLPADLEGTLNIEFDVSGDRDGVDVNPYGEYDAVSFSCRTCGLVLDGRRLIQASGVLENWEVPWDDVRWVLDMQAEDAWAEFEASGDRADYEREADENEPS